MFPLNIIIHYNTPIVAGIITSEKEAVQEMANRIRSGAPIGKTGDPVKDANELRIGYALTAAYLDESGEIAQRQKLQIAQFSANEACSSVSNRLFPSKHCKTVDQEINHTRTEGINKLRVNVLSEIKYTLAHNACVDNPSGQDCTWALKHVEIPLLQFAEHHIQHKLDQTSPLPTPKITSPTEHSPKPFPGH